MINLLLKIEPYICDPFLKIDLQLGQLGLELKATDAVGKLESPESLNNTRWFWSSYGILGQEASFFNPMSVIGQINFIMENHVCYLSSYLITDLIISESPYAFVILSDSLSAVLDLPTLNNRLHKHYTCRNMNYIFQNEFH